MEYSAQDIKGFLPTVEPTRSQELFLLNGSNYVFDAKGPRSVFGNRLLLPHRIGKPAYTQGIRLRLYTGDRCFTLTGDSILEWNESLGGWQVIYETPDTTLLPHRWTFGYLNGKMFFCHPRTGILVYDLSQNFCRKALGAGVPEDAIAVEVDNGRLIALTQTLFMWSAPSDGENFDPSLGGGGFQVISDRVPGSPIMVTSYTRGCLTWTTGGVMRSEFTGDTAVYHHRAVNTEYRPVNSFCSVRVDDDTVVILDERGLFHSQGESPQPYAPVFNEFLRGYIQENKLRTGDNLRLEWDELHHRLYVSTSLSYTNPLYENCFVYYQPLDKWGQFNELHYGILPLRIAGSERENDYHGFVDGQSRVRYWMNSGSRELAPENCVGRLTQNLYYPQIQKAGTIDETTGVHILGSSVVVNTFNEITLTQRAGFYDYGSLAPSPAELTGLDAKIQFGLLRFSNGDSLDEMSEVTNVLLRSVQSGESDQLTTDFNLVPDTTSDLNLLSGDVDYGFEPLNYVNHGLRVIATLDGITEFQSETPELVGFNRAGRYYACSVVGVWHIIELTATNVGEAFHLYTFKLTAVSAGKLN